MFGDSKPQRIVLGRCAPFAVEQGRDIIHYTCCTKEDAGDVMAMYTAFGLQQLVQAELVAGKPISDYAKAHYNLPDPECAPFPIPLAAFLRRSGVSGALG